jgi:hypothetical protein
LQHYVKQYLHPKIKKMNQSEFPGKMNMPQEPTDKEVKFEAPGIYNIRAQGILDAKWSARLGGMAITVTRPEDQAPVTTLTGKLMDQAALLGVLMTLYNLHLPVLSVEFLEKLEE